MCGGHGTRLDLPVEKPLVEIDGRTMVDRVRKSLAESRVEAVHAVVSPHAPATREHLTGSLSIIDAAGEGYVADLQHALESVETPVVTVAADLPLLSPEGIDKVLRTYDEQFVSHNGDSLSVCVPADLKRELGVSVGTTFEHDGRRLAPSGVNVVSNSEDDTMYVTDTIEFAVNVNHSRDAQIAEVLS